MPNVQIAREEAPADPSMDLKTCLDPEEDHGCDTGSTRSTFSSAHDSHTKYMSMYSNKSDDEGETDTALAT